MVSKFVSFLSIGGRSLASLTVEVLLLSIVASLPSLRPSSSSPPLLAGLPWLPALIVVASVICSTTSPAIGNLFQVLRLTLLPSFPLLPGRIFLLCHDSTKVSFGANSRCPQPAYRCLLRGALAMHQSLVYDYSSSPSASSSSPRLTRILVWLPHPVTLGQLGLQHRRPNIVEEVIASAPTPNRYWRMLTDPRNGVDHHAIFASTYTINNLLAIAPPQSAPMRVESPATLVREDQPDEEALQFLTAEVRLDSPTTILVRGLASNGNSSLAHKAYARTTVGKRPKHDGDLDITFGSENEEYPDHDDAMVISTRMANAHVKRVMIDMGNSVDIMYLDAFQKLGLIDKDLVSLMSALTGFSGDSISPLGVTTLPVTFREEPKQCYLTTTTLPKRLKVPTTAKVPRSPDRDTHNPKLEEQVLEVPLDLT
ncbi:hypothetical protein B296_00015776 [Ensete ventricosum]|uniref:Uncharacterized protein n=1 Tax=Ensete ventricosum TaxID=4639 RepID=A0A427B1S2_ENSVE|nr:hypothetical protein B296_00015776 [Ensete ventricosum]